LYSSGFSQIELTRVQEVTFAYPSLQMLSNKLRLKAFNFSLFSSKKADPKKDDSNPLVVGSKQPPEDEN
jgi:hypothetical protein